MNTLSSPPNQWMASLPNLLTWLRIVLTPVFVLLLLTGGVAARVFALLVFIIASVSDAYDGYLARKYDVVSKWGKFLDPLADKILVLSAFGAFWVLEYFPLWMLLLIALRDIVITGLRMWMNAKGTTLETSRFAKSKTAVQMTGIYTMIIFAMVKDWNAFGFLDPVIHWIELGGFFWWLMFIVVLLTVTTGLHYLAKNRRQLRENLGVST